MNEKVLFDSMQRTAILIETSRPALGSACSLANSPVNDVSMDIKIYQNDQYKIELTTDGADIGKENEILEEK